MKPCEIAVIVPVYNAAAYLTACTDAIAAQKFDGFRCIFCLLYTSPSPRDS